LVEARSSKRDPDGTEAGGLQRSLAEAGTKIRRFCMPLSGLQSMSSVVEPTTPRLHRGAASGSASKLSAMNAHSFRTEFAADSPLEGDGFELSVPHDLMVGYSKLIQDHSGSGLDAVAMNG
jgi:hypothetical protein